MRTTRLLVTGLALAAISGSSLISAAITAESSPVVDTAPDVRAYLIGGNVRSNSPNASSGWHIIDDANHDTLGLTGVTCLDNGFLRVSYPAAKRVGVLQANPDEAWAGKFEAGGSQGFSYTDLKITNGTGVKVSCDSTSLTSTGNWVVFGFMFKDVS